jgi:hypothetical protein
MFFLVPRFVLHKNVMLAQKLKFFSIAVSNHGAFRVRNLQLFRHLPSISERALGGRSPRRSHGHTTANWAILSAGTTFFQMPSWSIGGSADPAVPDGLDAVRQTVDPVPGSGGLIVGPLT